MVDPSVKVIPAGYGHHEIWKRNKDEWVGLLDPEIYNTNVLIFLPVFWSMFSLILYTAGSQKRMYIWWKKMTANYVMLDFSN